MANGRHQICDECAIDKCRMKKKFGNSIVCAVRYKVRGTVVHTTHNMTSYHRWIPSEWHICQTLEYCSSWAHSCLSKAVALCELDHNSLSRFIVNFKRLDASAFVCERVCVLDDKRKIGLQFIQKNHLNFKEFRIWTFEYIRKASPFTTIEIVSPNDFVCVLTVGLTQLYSNVWRVQRKGKHWNINFIF